MKLSIARSVAATMPVGQLAALARERGLAGVELRGSDLDEARAVGEALGRVVGIYVEALDEVRSEATMRASALLSAPVVAARGVVPSEQIPTLDAAYAAAGAKLLVTHGTDVEEVALLASALDEAKARAIGSAWEIRPATDPLSDVPAILMASAEILAHVRLHGGGPELRYEDAPSTGDLFSSLALSRYGGAVAMMPSSPEYAEGWESWLAGKIKNGCGTAYEKKKKREEASDRELDIRSVQPKHRLDTILSAYRALSPGRTLHVTFDHDPSCMYYTLDAMEPKDSFTFVKNGEGPDVWYADVTKHER